MMNKITILHLIFLRKIRKFFYFDLDLIFANQLKNLFFERSNFFNLFSKFSYSLFLLMLINLYFLYFFNLKPSRHIFPTDPLPTHLKLIFHIDLFKILQIFF